MKCYYFHFINDDSIKFIYYYYPNFIKNSIILQDFLAINISSCNRLFFIDI